MQWGIINLHQSIKDDTDSIIMPNTGMDGNFLAGTAQGKGWNVSSYLLAFCHAIIIINFGNEQATPTQEVQEHPPRPLPTQNHPSSPIL